jgi:hypothetical protein
MDTLTYQAGFGPVNSLPVRGHYLSRKKNWRPHEREFWAADLHRGEKHPPASSISSRRSPAV